eukprot:TRINITY_DN53068_c0_g1_i2.p1 TRINITY_DN53068_c0_g1~~TRINITY_DN53068_c0_g1_i2.p1  ORF type:complete len:154 (-),score=31.68 TRINITY_DN53068_c0_g1_i2:53-514(-)
MYAIVGGPGLDDIEYCSLSPFDTHGLFCALPESPPARTAMMTMSEYAEDCTLSSGDLGDLGGGLVFVYSQVWEYSWVVYWSRGRLGYYNAYNEQRAGGPVRTLHDWTSKLVSLRKQSIKSIEARLPQSRMFVGLEKLLAIRREASSSQKDWQY